MGAPWRPTCMRTPNVLLAGLVSLTLVAGACGDDDSTEAGDDPPAGVVDEGGGDLPDRSPDLTGTITAVDAFAPVTEDCVPAEDLPPDGTTSSDDPPTCTPEGIEIAGTVVVEEQPGVQEGRKISYTVTADTALAGDAGGTTVTAFADLAEGQTVDSWVVEGVCAESYPEQCGAEALRVTDP